MLTDLEIGLEVSGQKQAIKWLLGCADQMSVAPGPGERYSGFRVVLRQPGFGLTD